MYEEKSKAAHPSWSYCTKAVEHKHVNDKWSLWVLRIQESIKINSNQKFLKKKLDEDDKECTYTVHK
jgi:hypothetical protein